MSKEIILLDCTLRDGGLGFEDAEKSGQFSARFSEEFFKKFVGEIVKSSVEIIELGSIEKSSEDKTGFAIYPNIMTISEQIPKTNGIDIKCAALFLGPDTPEEEIPVWNASLCQQIRVILRYSELKKSLDFCKSLSKKGYKVFIQPALTIRYTDDEIRMLTDYANDMGAYALYFVDSFGYMSPKDVIRFTDTYDRLLASEIKIGFHAHNNMELAFSNAVTFLEQKKDRSKILDSCCLGMGRGAGNLQTEIISDYLIENYGKNYDYSSILNACEIAEHYLGPIPWGYSVLNLIPAIRKTAYKYSIALRTRYGLSYAEIDSILKKLPENSRHHCTEEGIKNLMELSGYGDRLCTNNKPD